MDGLHSSTQGPELSDVIDFAKEFVDQLSRCDCRFQFRVIDATKKLLRVVIEAAAVPVPQRHSLAELGWQRGGSSSNWTAVVDWTAVVGGFLFYIIETDVPLLTVVAFDWTN